jgi:membrane-bound serine protease (ClpP class)
MSMLSRNDDTGRWPHRAVLAVVLLLLAVARLTTGTAQDEPAAAREPVGRYLTLESPITDETIGWVRQTGLQLQQIAAEEGRPVYLILEIRPGTSQFHHVYALADFLTSADISSVNTVAWIPATVVGHNVIAALACSEIVMHPDAQIGDIGLGHPLAADQQQFVRNMVAKRRNNKVNESLATALMDPGATLVLLTVEPRPGEIEKRLVTEVEAQRVLAGGVEIKDRQTIKESGSPGLFSGAAARGMDVLVQRTASDRSELAGAYALPPEALREQRPLGGAKSVSVIEVSGMIEPILETFLVRQIDRAVACGARAIIFEINSGGGMLYSRDLAYRLPISNNGMSVRSPMFPKPSAERLHRARL